MDSEKPTIGDNVEGFDLSLVLDRDVLLQKLEATYGHRKRRAQALLKGFERFKEETAHGIKDDQMFARAGEFLKQIREFIAVIGNERKAAKKPLDEASAVVQKVFARDMIDPLSAAIETIELRMEQRAKPIAATAGREAAKVTSDQGVSSGLALTPWKVEVTDLEKVPLHYLMLNEAAAIAALKAQKPLAALAKLTDKQQPIAGLRFYRDTRINVR